MSSDKIKPEDNFRLRRNPSFDTITGRAWVKRHLEFWQPCTVERTNAAGVTVVLDNMDELTVERGRVQQFQLEPGDLVFSRQWYGDFGRIPAFEMYSSNGMVGLGGIPAFVLSARNEAVELEYPEHLFGKPNRYMHPLREICLYRDLTPTDWAVGQRVFGYVPKPMDPPLHLFFPGRVRAVHYDVCVEVGFDDKANGVVPTTLVENLEINVGDLVFTCTSYRDEIVASREEWSPCRVVELHGENLILQDALSQTFPANIEQIAVLPKYHQMLDGKLARFPGNTAGASGRSALAIKMTNAAHIVRSEHWLDAADDPISKGEVDALIQSDGDLAWSTEHWADMLDDGQVVRYPAILWRGEPTFWWYRDDIRCARPGEEELAKMIEIAVKLDANVVGNAGEEIH